MAGNSEEYDPSKDPSRKSKSPDPAWKYGFWPNLNAKDEALGASTNLEGRRSQRRGNASSSQVDASSDIEMMEEHEPNILNDDEDVDDDYGERPPTNNSERNDEARARDNILDQYDDL
ncbi:hypothetical protein POM88_001154 [Heracleum sosnowskyi]|uniref:Uncharacterized protein n=1 Tax=Heracleum sosnowskyi TaxID=360622 RepID=A0AAD8JDI9_9APIA|nr:hypothetical protein POM88_001154 [Heracleum sosnowskyi]